MNKKGSSMADLFLVIIVLFAFGMASLLAYTVFTSYNENYQAKDSIGAESKAMIQDNKDSYVNVVDPLVLFLVVGLTIALIVGASMIDTHPAVFVVAFIIAGIAVFMAAVYSNVYGELAADPIIGAVESEFTVLPFVMTNLPFIIAVVAFLVAVTLYSRSRGGEL